MLQLILGIGILVIGILVMAYILYKSPPGCSGDCNQGRQKCNCKK